MVSKLGKIGWPGSEYGGELSLHLVFFLNNEAKIFNPEVKKRQRDAYEDRNKTQFKEVPASEFIQTTDPISILGSLNRLSFD